MDNYKQVLNSYTSSDKNVWGPKFWYVAHNFAYNYPEHPDYLHKEIALNFIKMLPLILPCKECSEHSIKYVKSKSSELNNIVSSRANLVYFFNTFHNDINYRLLKPSYPLSY